MTNKTDRYIKLIELYSTNALKRLLDNSSLIRDKNDVDEEYQNDPIIIKIYDTLLALGLFETLQIITGNRIANSFKEIVEQ